MGLKPAFRCRKTNAYNLGIEVTKTFDHHDHCEHQLLKGVTTRKNDDTCIESQYMNSYCKAILYKNCTAFYKVTVTTDLKYEYINIMHHNMSVKWYHVTIQKSIFYVP